MKLNVHFFVFLIITLIVVISDILIYTLNLNYVLSVGIGAIVVLFFTIYFLKSKKIVVNSDFEKTDLLFLGIILIKFILCINRPDGQYDVSMYHIYNQEYPFIDKINFDYFPGRTLNSFLYPLGDRIFYLSRYLLGFRLGTILSYYATIIVFYELKKLVYCILGKEKDKRVSFLSNLILFIYTMYVFIGSYYIDIFSTVFILEILCLIFYKNNNVEFFKEKNVVYFVSLLTGISTGIKVSNLLLIFFIALYVLVKNIKNLRKLKIKNFIICIILFLFPFIVYMIDNIRQTGSPMFPYYNAFFKSEWFDLINWEDNRFGIPSIPYAFIWPLMTIINPSKTYDLETFDFIWGVGYIVTVIYLVFRLIRHKKEDKVFDILILSFVISLAWAKFLNGYVRYAYIVPILYIVVLEIVFINIDEKLKEKKNKVLLYIITGGFVCVIAFSSTYHIYIEARIFRESWADVQLLSDRKTEKIHINGAWMTLSDDSKLVTMVREEGTPIYYLESRFINSEKAKARQLELKQKELYTIIDDFNKYKKIDELTLENMEIEEVIENNKELNFLSNKNKVMICKIKYNPNSDEVKENNLQYYK